MRNKEQSDAITSGQYGPKLPGLGRAPTSGVCGLWPQRHCLPDLSRIRDKSGYTESWIIPKPYFSACFHADFVQKIRDNFSSLLSWFQYFFIRSF